MHYCINSLLKNNNEIMQYCIIINDIALIMHYRALLQMPDPYTVKWSTKGRGGCQKSLRNCLHGL